MPTKPIVVDEDNLMFTVARLDVTTSRALDDWIASIPEPRPDRAAAIGMALRDFLTDLGRLPHADAVEVSGWQYRNRLRS